MVVVLVMIVLASGLSFALGRIIDITTRQTFDRGSFNEAAIFGDIGDGPSTDDMFNQLNVSILRNIYLYNRDILTVHAAFRHKSGVQTT